MAAALLLVLFRRNTGVGSQSYLCQNCSSKVCSFLYGHPFLHKVYCSSWPPIVCGNPCYSPSIVSIQVNPRPYNGEVTSYYLFVLTANTFEKCRALPFAWSLGYPQNTYCSIGGSRYTKAGLDGRKQEHNQSGISI